MIYSNSIVILLIFLLSLMSLPAICSDSTQVANADNNSQLPSLEEVDRRLNNPLTSLWSLVFQENLKMLTGNLIDGTEIANNFFFQPALPVPVGSDYLFFARPVFPIVTNPVLSGDGTTTGHKTGFGDMQLFNVIGPQREDGLEWGQGATLIFPTASDDLLGSGKFQAGPAALFFHMGKPWTLGTLMQHWWSLAGDDA